jgi:hypothetical protein
MKQTLEMARENLLYPGVDVGDETIDQLKRFEALVRADEREACAKVAEDSDHVVGGRGYHDQLGDADATARNIAAAIRARGLDATA